MKKAFSRFSKTIKPSQRVITSKEEVIVPRSVQQGLYPNGKSRFKPQGLWYSCGNSWLEWCLSEDFGLEWKYVHEIDVDTSKLKLITNLAEFDLFSRDFGIPDEITWRYTTQPNFLRFDYINWSKLESLGFMGIEINPYLWKRRLDGGMWYYGWDCASGCIWNAEAVKNVKLIACFDSDKNRIVRVK